MNIFARIRKQLEEREGRSLSDWDISFVLRVQPNTLRRLMELPDSKIRPSYLMALQYVTKVGIEKVEFMNSPTTEELDDVCAQIEDYGMRDSRIAFFMGVSTRHLRNLRSKVKDVKFVHYLTARYLLDIVRPKGPIEKLERYAEAWASQ